MVGAGVVGTLGGTGTGTFDIVDGDLVGAAAGLVGGGGGGGRVVGLDDGALVGSGGVKHCLS